MPIQVTPDRFMLPAREFEPAYLALYRSGELQRRAQQAIEQLAACCLCPRNCGVDRLADGKAACKTGRYAVTGSYFAHRGEEDCLRGWKGSGLMAQYHPSNKVSFIQYTGRNRRVTLDEYQSAIEYAQQLGLQRLDERHRLTRL